MENAWVLNSWDEMMIPKPFSRAYIRVARKIFVPPDADEAQMTAAHVEMQAGARTRHCRCRVAFFLSRTLTPALTPIQSEFPLRQISAEGCSFQLIHRSSRVPPLGRNWEAGANPALPRNCKRVFGDRPLCKREGLRRSTRCTHRNSQVRRPARTFIQPLSREEES